VGPYNSVFDGGFDPPVAGTHFRGGVGMLSSIKIFLRMSALHTDICMRRTNAFTAIVGNKMCLRL